MSSHYINKSVKGKSIITNADIEGELNINTHITNQSGSTFDIGSSSSHFRNLYIDNINISSSNLQNYILDSFSSTEPIRYTSGNFSLNYSNHFGVSNGALISTTNTIPNVIAPIYQTQGSIGLSIDAPLVVSNDKLDLNLATTLSAFGIPIDKLFVNNSGKLDVNLDGLLIAGSGISKTTYLESILDFGLNYIPGVGDIIPELIFIKASIDTENLDFKSGNISIKSLGQSRVPFYNAFKLTSDSTFLYNDSTNELSVDRIVLNDTVDHNSNNNRVASKQYVDNLNTYVDDRPLFYTQASGSSTREWDIRLNSTYLSVDSGGSLITTITGTENKCISVTPDNKILLTYNNKHFGETTAGSLYSKLSGTTSGCIALTPDYEIELNYNTNQFTISNGNLQSTLIGISAGCISIDASNRVYLDYNTNDFNVTGGKLQLSLSTASTSAVLLNTSNIITFGYDTTYLSITANKVTFSSDIVTKVNKINTIETKVTTLESKMTTAEGNITTLQGRVTTAETTLTAHSTNLATLDGSVTANTALGATHTAQISTLTTGLAANVGATAILIASDIVHTADLNGLHAFIDNNILPDIDNLQSDVSNINSTIGSTNSRITTIENTITNGNVNISSSGSLNVQSLVSLGNLIVNNLTASNIRITGAYSMSSSNPFQIDLPDNIGGRFSIDTSGNVNIPILLNCTNFVNTNSTINYLRIEQAFSMSPYNDFTIDLPFVVGGRMTIDTVGNVNIPIKLITTNFSNTNSTITNLLTTNNTFANIVNTNLTTTNLTVGNISNNQITSLSSNNIVLTNRISTLESIVTNGNVNISSTGSLNVQGLTSLGNMLVTNTSISNVLATNISSGTIYTSDIFVSGTLTTVNITTQNLLVSTGNIIANTSLIDFMVATNISVSNFVCTNGSISNLVLTNLTVGNISNNQITSLSSNSLVLAGNITSLSSNSLVLAGEITSSNSRIVAIENIVTNGNINISSLVSLGNLIVNNATFGSINSSIGVFSTSIALGNTGSANVSFGGTVANVLMALKNGVVGGHNGSSVILIGGNNYHYSSIEGGHETGGETFLSFGTSSSPANPTEKLRITASGNVGINTSSPSFQLDVNGSSRFTSVSTPNANITNMTATNISCNSLNLTSSSISNSIFTNITSTNLNVSNVSATASTITNAIFTNISSNTLLSTSITTSNLIGTNITSTNLNVSASTITNSIFTNISASSLIGVANIVHTNISASSLIGVANIVHTNISASSLVGVTNIIHTNISSSSLILSNSLNANFNSNTIGNIITTGGNVGISTVVPLSRFHLSTGNTYCNLLFEPGILSDGSNSGIGAINWNGYFNGSEQRINTSKNRWRIWADQRGSTDTFNFDTYNGSLLSTLMSFNTSGLVSVPNLTNTNITISNIRTSSYSQDSSSTFEVDSPGVPGGRFSITTDGLTNLKKLYVSSATESAYSRVYCNGPGFVSLNETQSDYCARFASWVWFNTGFRINSDRRIKENIKTLCGATTTKKFKKLRAVSYNHKDRILEPNLCSGFIAQEIEEIYPEAVSSKQDYLPDVMTNVQLKENSFIYEGYVKLSSKILIYYYISKIQHKKEVTVKKNMPRKSRTYTFSPSLPKDVDKTIFIYGNHCEDVKNVNYNYFIPILVAELQESNKTIQELSQRLEKLEQK